jgi:hypothetical protein
MDLVQFYGTLFWFSSDGSLSFHFFSRISNFFDLSLTEETWVFEMRIWCIKIGNVLVLRFKEYWKSKIMFSLICRNL